MHTNAAILSSKESLRMPKSFKGFLRGTSFFCVDSSKYYFRSARNPIVPLALSSSIWVPWSSIWVPRSLFEPLGGSAMFLPNDFSPYNISPHDIFSHDITPRVTFLPRTLFSYEICLTKRHFSWRHFINWKFLPSFFLGYLIVSWGPQYFLGDFNISWGPLIFPGGTS